MNSQKIKNKGIPQNAVELAVSGLRNRSLEHIKNSSGAVITGDQISIKYFNREYRINFPEISFCPENVSYLDRVLILHYLLADGNMNAKGEYVGYNNLPNGMFYYSAFRRNGPGRILNYFGENPSELIQAGKVLGGKQAEYQDVSVSIPVFPKIDIIIILSRGDDEFPPDVKILFKDYITSFLPLEDISILCGIAAGRLIKQASKILN